MADDPSGRDPTTVGSALHTAATASPTPASEDAREDAIVKEEIKIGLNQPDGADNNDLRLTRSYATDTSAATGATGLSRSNTKEQQLKPWYKKLNPLRWSPPPPVPEERQPSREYTAGFFSLLVFQWMEPFMKIGYKRPLEMNDIWSVNPDRAAEVLSKKLNASFQTRLARGDKRPLVGAIHETFFWELWLGGFCQLCATIFQVMSPFTLRYLIQFATDAYAANLQNLPAPHIGHGVGLAVGITLMQISQSLGINHFIYRGMMVGGEMRAALISLIFEKTMVLSGRAKSGGVADDTAEGTAPKPKTEKKTKKPKGKGGKGRPGADVEGAGWGNGRIINLMSVDTYRVDQASALFHMIWTAPLSCLLTLILLLINLSYSALAGFALLVISVPLLTRAIRSLFVRRKGINVITDQRVSLTQEILQSVRFVKYFGWESSFLERLQRIRNGEIHSIQVLLTIRNAINAVSIAMPIFASMLAFITYSLTSHNMSPAEIFSSLALFNGLRMPLNLFPMVLGQTIDALQSIKRIEEFLKAEEMTEEVTLDLENKNAIEVRAGSFTWERASSQEAEASPRAEGKNQTSGDGKATGTKETGANPDMLSDGSDISTLVEMEPFKLQDINLEIGRNELVAVIGTVGCGKTSLLAALAGDMRKTSGEVTLGATRAFCPQYAWIQNTTLRQNVLFGKDMDRAWYKKVINACALQPDLDMLPNGDMTEIGERGITISGGQKQRLNIARAIYFDADLVLMDDPLSAVDAHVGRHIFDNAIMGLMKDKCRILATHQLWVLNRCDRIIWMDEGKIRAIDTFDNLMANHAGFQHLMETTALEQKHPDSDPAKEAPVEEQKKKKKKGVGLMQQEERAVSSVPWSVYGDYIRASGSIINFPILLSALVLAQGVNIATSLWLSYWVSDKFGMSTGQYIAVYCGLGVAQALLMFIFSVMLTVFGTRASKKLLHNAMVRTLRAPMSFFDTTPLGRITNRFSRDVDVMDNNLTDAIRLYFFTLAMIISVFSLIIAFFHYFVIALVPLVLIFLFATSYYRASAREVKRYESVLRSVVFAQFGEGLSGVASIRAYGLQKRFIEQLRASIDNMNSAYYLTFSNQRWLAVRLDAIGNLLVFTTGILVVTSRFNVPPSISGLVLSYILAIVQMIQFTVRQLAEVENGMNAVERLIYYGTQLEEEAPLHTVEVPKSWPEKGAITFDNVEMRYRAETPLVLKGLSMSIAGGERMGVVGRTGAGKSSIMSTLFRLVELSGGHITIDGLDISKLGLNDLRSRLAIIPQDPTLFRGTVRSNLDPFNEHTDLELWSALRQADLVSPESGPTATGEAAAPKDVGRIHLDSSVEEDGLNFSLGQRQLMALARALVRGSRIIVCDEATSSVDMETDDKIQNTIATAFRGCTLLCIAHRLRTIIGYDRICVMDNGHIAELDTPLNLWNKEGGIFRGMCDRSGIRVEDIRSARVGIESISGPESEKVAESEQSTVDPPKGGEE